MDSPVRQFVVLGALFAIAGGAGAPVAASSTSPRIAGAELEAEARAALNSTDLLARERALRSIVERWIAVDPARAIEWILRLPQDSSSGGLLNHAMQAWAGIDPGAAFTRAAKLDSRMWDLSERIVQVWAERSPQEAIAFLRNLPAQPGSAGHFRTAFALWAKSNPKAALAAALDLWKDSPRVGRNKDILETIGAAIAAVAREDAGAARAALAAWPDVSRPALLHSVIPAATRSNPDFAVELLLAFPVDHIRQSFWEMPKTADGIFYDQIGFLVARGPRAALDWAAKLPDGAMRRLAYEQIVREHAEFDLEAAKAALELLPRGDKRHELGQMLDAVSRAAAAAAELEVVRTIETAAARPSLPESSALASEADAALKFPFGSARDSRVNEIITRWAAIDRPRALRWASRVDDRLLRRDLNTQLISTWAKEDPKAAFEYCWHRISPWECEQIARDVIGHWAARAPREALDYFQGLLVGFRPADAVMQVLLRWVQSDPAAAMTAARSLPGRVLAQYYHGRRIEPLEQISELITRLARVDPAAARKLAIEPTDERERFRLLRAVVAATAHQEPALAAEIWFALPIGEMTSEDIDRSFKPIVAHDPTRAQQWASSLADPGLRAPALLTIVERFAEYDITAALAGHELMPMGPSRKKAALAIARAWARSDVPAVRHWAAALSDAEERAEALGVVAVAWGESEPIAALELAATLTDSQLLQNDLLSRWCNKDRVAALAWVLALPPSPRQEACFRYVRWCCRFTSVSDAERFLDGLPNDDLRRMAIPIVARFRVETDPAEAARWAGTLEDSALRQDVLRSAVRVWFRTDSTEATRWLETLPPDSFRDELVSDHLSFIARPAATRLIGTLEENRRDNAISAYFRIWILRDRSLADVWLRDIAWPESKKAALIASASKLRDPRPTID